MKKNITALFAATVFGLSLPVASADSNINIYVNNRPINTEAFILNDSTYIPLRAVSEALGANLIWNGDSRSVYIEQNEDSLVSQIISDASQSVVAVVGNYKPDSLSYSALSYNEPTAHGSGFVIKSGGVIMTNAHVVKDIDNLTVVFADGESCGGKVQYIDEKSDLAVIKVDRLGLKPITFAKEGSAFAGETAIAIGTPLSLTMRNSASKGIVSGVDVSVKNAYYPLLQTDAAINPGNSGGPLLNSKGQLIGVNSSGYVGVGVESLNFAIPVDTVNYVLNQFEKNGRVIRPDLGVTLENSWEARIGLPTKKGVTVKTSEGYLSSGDVINKINGIDIHSIIDYNRALRDSYYDGNVEVTFTRDGKEITQSIKPQLK